jgi:hypothetical protein
MPLELSEAERAVIAAIMAGEKAWSNIEGLARAGHELETIAGLMIEGIGARTWLDNWNHPDDGPCVTLTSWGASQWAELHRETLELAERPATVKRGEKPGKPLTPAEKQKRDDDRILTSRVVFWVEGGEAPPAKRKRLVEHRAPLPELVRAREPEFLVDEVSGQMVELFTKLFDGTKVQGIKVKIDPKLKGNGGKKAKGKAAKRRRAG